MAHRLTLTGEAGGWLGGLHNHVPPARLAPTYHCLFFDFSMFFSGLGMAIK